MSSLVERAVANAPRLAALGERWAPGVTAALAVRLWATLPPPHPAEHRARWSKVEGTPLVAQVTGGTVVASRFGDPEAPLAWLVHGWGGWRQQLESLVEPLLAAGYQVISHDALSHGDSTPGRHGPRSASAPEMGHTLADLAAQWGQPHLVGAHSLGAQATAWAHAHHGLDYRKLVLVAPSVSIEDMVTRFTAHVPLGPRVHRRFMTRLTSSIGYGLEEFDLRLRAAERPREMPLLVVHDEGDTETPIESASGLVEAWPGAELVTTQKLGHLRILRSPALKRAVADWLARHPV